jgi:GLPGLI family protein
MKKSICYFLAFFLSICSAKAQSSLYRWSQYDGVRKSIDNVQTLDSARLKITYLLKYVPDSTNSKNVLRDKKILLVGDSIKHFYSAYVRQSDSAITADYAKGKKSAPLKFAPDVLGEVYDIYTGSSDAENRFVVEWITNLSTYGYKENIEFPNWAIEDSTCTVLGYSCRKATARFRGRDWTVWFGTAIPLNTGPWKLGGLPGLILKASDSRAHYVFECIGMEQFKKKKEPIILKNAYKYTKCSREEYRKAQSRFYNDHVNVLLSLGWNVNIVDNNGNRLDRLETPDKTYEERNISWSTRVNVADRYKKLPYNPIELE